MLRDRQCAVRCSGVPIAVLNCCSIRAVVAMNCSGSRSGSSHVGITSPVQAHVSLEDARAEPRERTSQNVRLRQLGGRLMRACRQVNAKRTHHGQHGFERGVTLLTERTI